MQIKVAEHSGFCFGVRRAIKIAEKELRDLKNKKNIYSLGAIIHNPQVVDSLSKKGLSVINNIDSIKKGSVIISSHGAPDDLIKKIKNKKLTLIDATCPFVKHVHAIVKGLKKENYRVIIIGDKTHPEVKALLSLAGKGVKNKKIGIVSQTTQDKDGYLKAILDVLKDDFTEVKIFNTICNDTAHRQMLARRLLNECDIMIVVGGKNSANTKRLWQICKESGVGSYHIEKETELKRSYFSGKKCVGVASGASTPDQTVKKVVKKIETFVN
ncbi:4-hydroxy-3-methylbut-2-enyl diphosphate reductase [Candidatus Omnitrophota bacterium]